jgi:hypothetical protein
MPRAAKRQTMTIFSPAAPAITTILLAVFSQATSR